MRMEQQGKVWLAGVVASLVVAAGAGLSAQAQAKRPFKIENRWTIGGEGGWDYLTVDSAAKRLYIAHQTKVDVVDLTSGKVIGAITGLTRCHGVVMSPDSKTGYISDGGANAVVVFDPSNFAKLGSIATATNPDGMAYEPTTKTLWAFNGGSKSVTVIDPASRKVVGTVEVPGKPEFPVVDGAGAVYVNIEDKNVVLKIDAKAQKVVATWPLAQCESPSGQAIDTAGMRLFAVCDGKKMPVTDARTGKSLGVAMVGEGPDATAYDAKARLAFSSNGESGTLTIVDAGKPGYPVAQTLKTMAGARTMQLDAATGKVYLVSAELVAMPGQKRPSAKPGSFVVLEVGRD
jgi:YVTN family beta-propeller protein